MLVGMFSSADDTKTRSAIPQKQAHAPVLNKNRLGMPFSALLSPAGNETESSRHSATSSATTAAYVRPFLLNAASRSFDTFSLMVRIASNLGGKNERLQKLESASSYPTIRTWSEEQKHLRKMRSTPSKGTREAAVACTPLLA